MPSSLKYIANFAQPPQLLSRWKDDGCNLFIICPQGSDKKAWRAECRRLNVQYIDTPSADPTADIADPLFIGWALPDEPRTLRGTRVGTEVSVYRALCAALRHVSPTHKLWGTFAGMDITAGYPWYKGEKDKPYFGDDAAVDRVTDIATDWYPKNRDAAKYGNDLVVRQQTLVQAWTNNTRSYWNVLEASDQCLKEAPNRQIGGPTRQDMLDQARLSVEAGVIGLCYFSTAPPGPWGWGLDKPQNNFDSRNDEQRATFREIVKTYLNTTPTIEPAPVPVPEWQTKYDALDQRTKKLEAFLNALQSALKEQ
jgi:hypothetical protein